MNPRQLVPSLLAILGIGATCTLQAASLVVEDGEILGVRDLEIHGQLYELSFADTAFNSGYPAAFAGYLALAQDAAEAIVAASDSGRLQGETGLKVRGCGSTDACTILIPDHATGTAPSATMSYACELVYSGGGFGAGDPQWPFDPSMDTSYMPDMTYGVLTPAR